MKITFISDTHTKHRNITEDLPGGDLLIHAGDFMNQGYHQTEAIEFFDWLDNINNYDHKIFIAGNHDRWMENAPDVSRGILTGYKTIDYLEDDWLKVGEDMDNLVKIYGSPWQPEFYNWAFNLPRNGWELEVKWKGIPDDTDILVTHGPSWGNLDTVYHSRSIPLGCELLAERIKEVKPKIHVCGHIHTGYGYKFENGTHFFNAAVLDERYNYTQRPVSVDWNPDTNEIVFL